MRPARSESRISAVASTGSRERPSAREKTFVEPPGTTASIGRCGRGAVLQQPVDDLVDGAVAAQGHDEVDAVGGGLGASSRACPRWAVSTTSTLSSLARAPTRTSRILAVVLVAAGLTTTSARMAVRLATRGLFAAESGAGPPGRPA